MEVVAAPNAAALEQRARMNAQLLYLWASEQAGRDAKGQGLVEYGLIISLISVFAILSLAFFGSEFFSMLNSTTGLSTCLQNPFPGCF